jgi:hypothetical protein
LSFIVLGKPADVNVGQARAMERFILYLVISIYLFIYLFLKKERNTIRGGHNDSEKR